MTNKQWWVLRCLPQLEITAEKLVRRIGYQAMAPYEERLARRGKARHPRKWKFALYPGYLFASWPDWNEGWNRITGKINPIDSITAIYGFLHPMWTTMPYILPAADVEYLYSIAEGRYRPEEPAKKLKVGDRVLIPEGVMQGYTGTATEISGGNVTVEVKREKNTVKIKTKLANLEKV